MLNAYQPMSEASPFWPPRLPRAIDVPATGLPANLEIAARRYPDRAALVFFDRVVTYRQLADEVTRAARALRRLGTRPGDRVLLDMQNCPQLVVAHFAILGAGAVVVPANPMNRAGELRHLIADAGARVAITTADLAPELASATAGLAEGLMHLIVAEVRDAFDAGSPEARSMPRAWQDWLMATHALPSSMGLTVATWSEWLCTGAGDEPLPPEPQPRDLAVLPYTSGTTGQPKGCMHTHESLMHNAVASQLWIGATTASVVLAVIPLFHITGMVTVLHGGIWNGSTLVLMPRWDRAVAARLIRRWRITHWVNIPTMVIDLLGDDALESDALMSLAFIGGGGAAMPEAVAARLMDRTGLRYVEGYGLTETAAPTHFNPPDAPKPQCLGIPFIGIEACLLDADTGRPAADGDVGEIVVRGPGLFQGYWQQPEATASAFVEIDGRPWFRTGDIGRVDADGYYAMTDRLKRMINASGYKVWPAEVEATLYRHPAIREACVVATRHAYRGESVMAVVVLRDGAALDADDLIDWCRGQMAAYKVPREVRFERALPKSGSGKVMWRALQDAIAHETDAATRPVANHG